MAERNYNEFSETLKEAPYYHEGITFEEYDQEREYYLKILNLCTKVNMFRFGNRNNKNTFRFGRCFCDYKKRRCCTPEHGVEHLRLFFYNEGVIGLARCFLNYYIRYKNCQPSLVVNIRLSRLKPLWLSSRKEVATQLLTLR